MSLQGRELNFDTPSYKSMVLILIPFSITVIIRFFATKFPVVGL